MSSRTEHSSMELAAVRQPTPKAKLKTNPTGTTAAATTRSRPAICSGYPLAPPSQTPGDRLPPLIDPLALFLHNARMAASDSPSAARAESYRDAGVDPAEADSGLQNIIRRVQGTWPARGRGRVILPIGYFANVIEMDGVGIAICTDGVGSKTILADLRRKYDTIGIDCVAMNVNDMICVGAEPLSLVDYIAPHEPDAALLDAVAVGLCEGARQAGVSISG